MDEQELRRRFESGVATPPGVPSAASLAPPSVSVAPIGGSYVAPAPVLPPVTGDLPNIRPDRGRWFNFWQAPDQVLVEAGAEGEWLVARLRVVIVALLLITPLYRFLANPDVSEYAWGLGVTVFAFASALAVYLALRRGEYRTWLGFASSAFDVTLVSSALLGFLIAGPPQVAVNSKVTFEIYFLAIMATSLRYDRRVCIASGMLAIAQYGAIVVAAMTLYDMNDPKYIPLNKYGTFFGADQVTRVILLAATTLLAHEMVRRAQRLRYLSTHDRLTGLSNRHHFDERTKIEVERARRYGRVVTVAMIDVDHFKRFNDSFGHSAGDAVLRMIAGMLRESVRGSDLVARYGGEEFVLVFPETGEPEAADKIEQIREKVASSRVVIPGHAEARQVTVSAGVSVYPEDAKSVAELLDVADKRLFEAKQRGRNRVVGAPNGHHAGTEP